MSGVKISALPAANAANDSDQIEANQAGTSRRVTVDQIAERIAASDWVQDQIDSITFPSALPPSGPASGDLTGGYPGPSIKSSVALLGAPSAPTAVVGTDTTQLATTAFVQAAIAAIPAWPFLDPDTTAWRQSVLTNGGVVSNAQITAVDNLINALRTAGAYNLMDDIWLLASESSIQTLTSLKQRRLGVAMNAPIFSKRGTVFNGTNQYIKTGFIPSTHAAQMTGTVMQVGVWSMANVFATQTTFGLSNSLNQCIQLIPRSGGAQYYYGLNSTPASAGANADATGLVSAYRNGSSFGSRARGADGLPFVPGASTTVLPTIEAYIGARNLVGTADNFYAGALGLIFIGSDLTLAREPAVYAAFQAYLQATGAFDAYISSTGSDSNPGTAALPYLTWDKGYTNTGTGATLWLDGTAAVPQTFTVVAQLNLAKAITVRAINPRGAILKSTNATRVITTNPTAGETITLRDLIFDATGGPSIFCLQLATQATAYRVNITNCKFQNWTGATSNAIISSSTANRVHLTVTGCDFVADDVVTAIDLNLTEGGGIITNCTATLTNHTGTAVFAIDGYSTTPGAVYGRVDGCTISSTMKSTMPAGITTLVSITNMTSPYIGNCTGTHEGNGSARSSYSFQINTNFAGDATEIPCDDAIIENCTIYSTCAGGGHMFGIGAEATAKQSLRPIIRNCTATTNNIAAPHGVFMGRCTDGKIYGNTLTHPGAPIVNKNSINSEIYNNTVTAIGGAAVTNTAMLHKGATGGTTYSNTFSFSAGPSNGTLVYLEDDTAGSGTFTSGVVISANSAANNGGLLTRFVYVKTGSAGTFDHNTYTQNSGTLQPTLPFSWQGTSYATFAAWQAAHEPTAAANFP